MSDAVECISLDALGTTIAIGHGRKVSVIDQATICAYVSALLHILNSEVFQLCGGISGFSQIRPHSITSKRSYPLFPPVLCTL